MTFGNQRRAPSCFSLSEFVGRASRTHGYYLPYMFGTYYIVCSGTYIHSTYIVVVVLVIRDFIWSDYNTMRSRSKTQSCLIGQFPGTGQD